MPAQKTEENSKITRGRYEVAVMLFSYEVDGFTIYNVVLLGGLLLLYFMRPRVTCSPLRSAGRFLRASDSRLSELADIIGLYDLSPDRSDFRFEKCSILCLHGCRLSSRRPGDLFLLFLTI